MKNIIGADAAKLAGLQIDLLQKVRLGHITLGQLEWFSGLSKDMRDALVAGEKLAPKPSPSVAQQAKFAEFLDLGVIVVPDDYNPATWLASSREQYGDRLYYYNDAITDANFSNPSRTLKVGDRLRVRAHKQIVRGSTTSEERLAYLKSLPGNQLVGAQGAVFVLREKRDQLPKGKWYASFDEKERLPLVGGYHGVPGVHAYSDGDFRFGLGGFEGDWGDDFCLLSFCDEPLEA